jgi:hypothetical protein
MRPRTWLFDEEVARKLPARARTGRQGRVAGAARMGHARWRTDAGPPHILGQLDMRSAPRRRHAVPVRDDRRVPGREPLCHAGPRSQIVAAAARSARDRHAAVARGVGNSADTLTAGERPSAHHGQRRTYLHCRPWHTQRPVPRSKWRGSYADRAPFASRSRWRTVDDAWQLRSGKATSREPSTRGSPARASNRRLQRRHFVTTIDHWPSRPVSGPLPPRSLRSMRSRSPRDSSIVAAPGVRVLPSVSRHTSGTPSARTTML